MDLAQFNSLDADTAQSLLLQACASSGWVQQMNALRPFESIEQMLDSAAAVWDALAETDFLEAFDGHPKIGDPDSLKAKYRDTHAMASGEQAGVDEAGDDVIDALARANDQYVDRFGFIFIICATGKSALQMLHSLEARLDNDKESELAIAAAEQAKITAIRLRNLLAAND